MHSRREFISVTGGALMATTLASFANPHSVKNEAGYQLLILATNWGFSGTWAEFCKKAKQAGYDGVEVWFPSDFKSREELVAALKENALQIAFVLGGADKDPQKHFVQFKESLEAAVLQKPLYINCHSGRDFFSFEENKRFIDLTTELSRTTQVPMYHETHRSRILYSAPIARQYMEKIPELRVTFDVSHWCNVHESLLEDQPEALSLAVNRTEHIHARIGHPEGPQVNDPRAPEWKKAMDAHLGWWDRVVEIKKKEGRRMTILTEFGPVDYMPALPYTRQPLSNQWEINAYMLEMLRKRYS